MASSYPGSLDSFTNPSSTDAMDASAALYHDTQHANANDAIEAVQATLGTSPAGAQATVRARLDELATVRSQFLPWTSGTYLGTYTSTHGTTTSGSTTLSLDRLYLQPVWVPVSATIDRIAVYCYSAQASANCRLGLYATSGTTGKPTGAVVTDFGEIDLSGTGYKELTVSQALTAGVVWIGILNETSSVNLSHGGAAYNAGVTLEMSATTALSTAAYYQTGATYTSGFPTIGSLTAWDSGPFYIVMRRT